MSSSSAITRASQAMKRPTAFQFGARRIRRQTSPIGRMRRPRWNQESQRRRVRHGVAVGADRSAHGQDRRRGLVPRWQPCILQRPAERPACVCLQRSSVVLYGQLQVDRRDCVNPVEARAESGPAHDRRIVSWPIAHGHISSCPDLAIAWRRGRVQAGDLGLGFRQCLPDGGNELVGAERLGKEGEAVVVAVFGRCGIVAGHEHHSQRPTAD